MSPGNCSSDKVDFRKVVVDNVPSREQRKNNSTILELKSKINLLESKAEVSGLSNTDLDARLSMMKQLEELQHIKNLDLLQKAKIRWVVDGDENSKFFHGMINSKFARTRINGIYYNGSWILEPSIVISHIYNFHEAKFEDNLNPRPRFTSNLFKKISESDSSILDAPFSLDEIKNAVFDCGGGKAPGPDGFTFKSIK
ncbi:hypothetical protein Tco_0635677 [Tanacetum coccineum]